MEILQSNCQIGWMPVKPEEAELLIANAAGYNKISVNDCLKKLDEAKLQYGTGLYYEPVYIVSKKLYDTCRQREIDRKNKIGYVRCDCGHTILKSQVMGASLGSSCPDCYDRMSG